MKYIVNKINESLKYKIILIKDGRKHKGKFDKIKTLRNIMESRKEYQRYYSNNLKYTFPLIIDHLVRFLLVEPIHLSLSSRLGTSARIFLDLFQDLKALCFQW